MTESLNKINQLHINDLQGNRHHMQEKEPDIDEDNNIEIYKGSYSYNNYNPQGSIPISKYEGVQNITSQNKPQNVDNIEVNVENNNKEAQISIQDSNNNTNKVPGIHISNLNHNQRNYESTDQRAFYNNMPINHNNSAYNNNPKDIPTERTDSGNLLIEKDQMIFNTRKELRESEKQIESLNKLNKKYEETILNYKSKCDSYQSLTERLQEELQNKTTMIKELNSKIDKQTGQSKNIVSAYENKINELVKSNEVLGNNNKALLFEIKKSDKTSSRLKDSIEELKRVVVQGESLTDEVKKENKALKSNNKKMKEQEMLINFLKAELSTKTGKTEIGERERRDNIGNVENKGNRERNVEVEGQDGGGFYMLSNNTNTNPYPNNTTNQSVMSNTNTNKNNNSNNNRQGLKDKYFPLSSKQRIKDLNPLMIKSKLKPNTQSLTNENAQEKPEGRVTSHSNYHISQGPSTNQSEAKGYLLEDSIINKMNEDINCLLSFIEELDYKLITNTEIFDYSTCHKDLKDLIPNSSNTNKDTKESRILDYKYSIFSRNIQEAFSLLKEKFSNFKQTDKKASDKILSLELLVKDQKNEINSQKQSIMELSNENQKLSGMIREQERISDMRMKELEGLKEDVLKMEEKTSILRNKYEENRKNYAENISEIYRKVKSGVEKLFGEGAAEPSLEKEEAHNKLRKDNTNEPFSPIAKGSVQFLAQKTKEINSPDYVSRKNSVNINSMSNINSDVNSPKSIQLRNKAVEVKGYDLSCLEPSKLREILDSTEDIINRSLELLVFNKELTIENKQKKFLCGKLTSENDDLKRGMEEKSKDYEKNIRSVSTLHINEHENTKQNLIEKIQEFSNLLEESKRIIYHLEQENMELKTSQKKMENNLQLIMKSHQELESNVYENQQSLEYELEKNISQNNVLIRDNELKKIQIESYENQLQRNNHLIYLNTVNNTETIGNAYKHLGLNTGKEGLGGNHTEDVPEIVDLENSDQNYIGFPMQQQLIPSFKDINNSVFTFVPKSNDDNKGANLNYVEGVSGGDKNTNRDTGQTGFKCSGYGSSGNIFNSNLKNMEILRGKVVKKGK